MSTRTDHLILSASIAGLGYHPGAAQAYAQRLTDAGFDYPPGTAQAYAQRLTEVAYYRQLVQTAERGLLDFVLLHDERALPDTPTFGRLDALSVLSRLAPETTSIGLAVSVPTTYSEPFNVSRELATLDFVSGGRAAWNVTSAASDAEARNFGHEHAPAASERHVLAEEFVEVSRKLWDSWEDDAVITDRERGLYLDPAKLHHINHVGQHFKIRGPQITYRPPQGHVVVVQTDQGDPGVPLSGANADVLILHHATLEQAQRAYAERQREAAAAGREIRVLQSILPIQGETEAHAYARAAELDAAAATHNVAAVEPRALRVVGTPVQIADLFEQWFEAHAADGFHILPAVLPDGLERLTDDLVPELQRRGLFRSAYAGRTLRDHLRLPRPASQYAAASAR